MSGLALYNYELDDGCYRVRLALSMLSLDWTPVSVDVFPGREQQSPAYVAMNPSGRLPILKDGAVTVSGAEAILAYLAVTYDPAGRWLPKEGAAFAGVQQWLGFSARDASVTFDARQSSLFDAPGDEKALQAASAKVLRIMDDHLTLRSYDGGLWFVGAEATIADIALFPVFALSRDFGIDHDDYPALRRWARRFRALPGFKTMPGIPDYH